MFPVFDLQVRLVLLGHLALRAGQGAASDLRAAGIDAAQLARLRELSALELIRLAAMRHLPIGVAFDLAPLDAALRAVSLAKESSALEAYFIRHGASSRMMSTLFKLRRTVVYRRRHAYGAWRRSGRIRLPERAARERIFRVWLAIDDPNPRMRYYRLHQAFPHDDIAALESVVREFEASQ
jgi:hypothetical protein